VDKLSRLGGVIRTFQPDVIHVHDPLGKVDGLYFRYLRPRRTRLCYTVHWLGSPSTVRRWFQVTRHRGADALFVHSAEGAALLREEGIRPGKIWEVPHGNFLHLCGPLLPPDAARRRIGLPPEARALLFFGAIEARKGLDALIEAFGLLTRGHPDLWMVVAGPPREDLDAYKAQIERLGLSGRVVFDARYVSFAELPAYFGASDVVVLPYRQIVQSGVLQLAYGFSRPVVVSNIGGIAQAVRDDGTGVVARSAAPADLAEAIDGLLRDPAHAASLGRRGRALAETKYSWPVVAGQIAEVYRAIVRQGDGPA
jgi:glycosyltransferase involved in cell wall biosynthesis